MDFQQNIATLGIMNVKNTHSMVNQESLTCDAFLQKRIRYTHSVQEEVVGGPKMPFLFTFRVKNVHVYVEVKP